MQEVENISNDLIDVVHRMAKNNLKMVSGNLMHGEMAVLFFVGEMANQEKEMSPSFISGQIGIKRSGVTVALNSLEKKELIVRKRADNAQDRRKISVYITPKGTELVSLRKKHMLSVANNIVSSLGIEKANQLNVLLQEVAEIIKKNNEKG